MGKRNEINGLYATKKETILLEGRR